MKTGLNTGITAESIIATRAGLIGVTAQRSVSC